MFSVFSALFGFVNLAVHISFLIVTLTAVRTRRPDAFFPFTIAAGIFLLQTVMNLIGPIVIARIVVASSYTAASGMSAMYSMMYGFGTMMATIAWILVMIGLVKIASPPQEFSPHRPPGGY